MDERRLSPRAPPSPARHAAGPSGTTWPMVTGSHPHPLADPTGRWISFNAAHGKRGDVYVVRI